jgi:hypothetical protein
VKVIALLFILLGVLLILGLGLFYLLGFAMSFDAPGSQSDPKAWLMRFLMFVPILVVIILLILAIVAYSKGYYRRSVILGSSYIIAFVGFFFFMMISSVGTTRRYQKQLAHEKEEELLYPKQKFFRQTSLGTDTIIVFPNRLVAYRLNIQGMENIWGGPLGDLNESRDVVVYKESTDTRLKREELHQFVDEGGRRFTDVYQVK